jgi:hypothetical protein
MLCFCRGSYGQHNATGPADCQAHCDGDPDCVMWNFGFPPLYTQCVYNRNSVHRQCPIPVPNGTLGFKNTTSLPGCVANTSHLQCSIEYTPATNASAAYYEVPVTCGGTTDTLRLLPSEKSVELRVFSDHSFIEAFFQRGRVAMTVPSTLGQPDSGYLSDAADMGVVTTVAMEADVQVRRNA